MASIRMQAQRIIPARLGMPAWSLAALLGVTVLRLVMAGSIPLSADEAYYRVWAHALAPGYPDHPPMVALWMRAGIAVAGDTAFGLRLSGPLSALAGSLLLIGCGRDLALAEGMDAAAAAAVGRRAAWLLNGTLLCNAGAVIMTPDTPLLLFWTACLSAGARAIRSGQASWWLAAGIAAGLALDSKYTALLLAPALLAWAALVPGARHWLRCPHIYGGAALAGLLFLPVLVWNAAHDWASFARQGGRGADFRPAEAGRYLGELLAGQIGLATPILFVLFCWGVRCCVARGAWRRPVPGFLGCVTIVPALVFLQHALGDRVQANWPGIIYPGASLAAAIAVIPLRRSAVAMGAAISAALFLQASLAPLSLPRRFDFTLIRLAGWQGLTEEAEAVRAAQGASFLAADEYGLASELAYHAAAPVLGVALRWALFNLPRRLPDGMGILVRSDREAGPPDSTRWPGAVLVGQAVRARHGTVAERYRFYRVQLPLGVPAAQLPSRPQGSV